MTTIIVQTISRLMIPFIQLFGLYIIMHGHISPGGGFQGGVIVGASMILLAISFGLSEAEKRAASKIRDLMAVSGALLFTAIGLLGILAGGTFLEFMVIPLPMHPADVSELMIILIEIAIGVAV
ncbi:MAG: hypothetical protein LRZ87_00965, partial [Methanocellales archaeon]|nr:hypothetical protein [Methanocellales archaeon]